MSSRKLIAWTPSGFPRTSATPSAFTWAVLLLMGLFATVGQMTLTRAYVHAPAASVGPFLYVRPVFAGLLAWLIWDRLPDALFVAGAAIVVLAATLALRIEGEMSSSGRPATRSTR